MTQEEKARAYDRAIEKIKYVMEHGVSPVLNKEDLQDIFPELKESEDENIRKALLEMVHDTTGDELWVDYNVHKEDALAWLEKQGEQKPAEWHSEDEQNLNACLGYIPDEFLRRWLMDVVHVKYDKFADKVEPKFKVGDWIIFNQNHNSIYQVERIDKYRYYLRHYLGGTLSVHFDIELIRQWNIQDAKDGDVLVCNEEILLFKSYSVQGRISLYCWYNGQTNNFHSKSITDTSLTTRNKICPATKEQRDTLFEKMKEAGWKWDEEKKELRMIEKQSEQKTDEWKEGNIIKRCNILALVIKGRRAIKSNGEIFTIQYPYEWVKAKPNEIEYFFNEFEKQSKQHKSEENGLSGCKVQ